jgi:hypothetical protein
MSEANESDWKLFRAMASLLRERYLREKNQELLEILSDDHQTHTDRFWEM